MQIIHIMRHYIIIKTNIEKNTAIDKHFNGSILTYFILLNYLHFL